MPTLSILLLLTGGQEPLLGWGSIWQWLVMTAGGAVATPILFQFFTWCWFANELTFAGHSDWRVPNALELCSIFNFGSGQFDGVTNGYYIILTATPIGEPPFSPSTPVFSSNVFSNYGEAAWLDFTPGMTYLVRSTA